MAFLQQLTRKASRTARGHPCSRQHGCAFLGFVSSRKVQLRRPAKRNRPSYSRRAYHYITPGYFTTVQTPILDGRDFCPQDRPDSPKVVIINREMAEKLWPGQSAIGKRIHYNGGDFDIVGIATDVRL